MTKEKKNPTGRPKLNQVRKHVYLTPKDINYILKLGVGNFSAGARELVRQHRRLKRVKNPIKTDD